MFKNKRHDSLKSNRLDQSKLDSIPCSYRMLRDQETEDTPIKLLGQNYLSQLDIEDISLGVQKESKQQNQLRTANSKLSARVAQLQKLLAVERGLNVQLVRQNRAVQQDSRRTKDYNKFLQKKIDDLETTSTAYIQTQPLLSRQPLFQSQNIHRKLRVISLNNPELGPLTVPSVTLQPATQRLIYKNCSSDLDRKRSESTSTISHSKHQIQRDSVPTSILNPRPRASSSSKGMDLTIAKKPRPKGSVSPGLHVAINRRSMYYY